MKRIFALIAFTVFSFANNAEAIEFSKPNYGGAVGFNLNAHSSDFKKIPECPSCSPGYESGSGSGLNLGGFVEFKLNPESNIKLNVFYNNFSANVKRDENTIVILNGNKVTGTFEHSLDVTLSSINIAPEYNYNVYDKINLLGGIYFGFMMQKDYKQSEKITSPSDGGTFIENNVDTKKRERNVFSGTLNNVTAPMGLMLGAEYEAPLNAKKTMLIYPQLKAYLGINNIIDAPEVSSWKANSFSLGVAVKYSPIYKDKVQEQKYNFDTIRVESKDVESPIVMKGQESQNLEIDEKENIIINRTVISRTDTLLVPKVANVLAKVDYKTYTATGEKADKLEFTYQRTINSTLAPMLNYVFFDDNSANIPKRYIKISKAETSKFQVVSMIDKTSLDIYYNVLNIIGRRLTENPNAKITVVGCNSDFDAEAGNMDLSKNRAKNVADYFTDVWNIDKSRIAVKSRNLPVNPATPKSEPVKIEENRRVEILSEEDKIIEPLFIVDTIVKTNWPKVDFKPYVQSDVKIDKWNVTVMQGSKELTKFEKVGDDFKEFSWNLANDENKIKNMVDPLRFKVVLTDVKGKVREFESGKLDFEIKTQTNESKKIVSAKEIDQYDFVYFDFNSEKISSASEKIIKFIKARIKDDSKVTIIGCSDNTGSRKYNEGLAERRAQSVNKTLKIKNADIKVMEEEKYLYDNATPEGRYYNRTTRIVVER